MATDDVVETLRLIDELCAEGAYPQAAALMGPLLAELDALPESAALGMALRADAQLQQCLGNLLDLGLFSGCFRQGRHGRALCGLFARILVHGALHGVLSVLHGGDGVREIALTQLTGCLGGGALSLA